MKINKVKKLTEAVTAEADETKVLTEAEESEETIEMNDTDLVIDDVKSASVDDIADAVIAAKEEGTDGAETYSDTNAKKIASEIKTYASGFDAAASLFEFLRIPFDGDPPLQLFFIQQKAVDSLCGAAFERFHTAFRSFCSAQSFRGVVPHRAKAPCRA